MVGQVILDPRKALVMELHRELSEMDLNVSDFPEMDFLVAHRKRLEARLLPFLKGSVLNKQWRIILPKWPILEADCIERLEAEMAKRKPFVARTYHVTPFASNSGSVSNISLIIPSKFIEVSEELSGFIFFGPNSLISEEVDSGDELLLFQDISVVRYFDSIKWNRFNQLPFQFRAVSLFKAVRDFERLKGVLEFYEIQNNFFENTSRRKDVFDDVYNSILVPEKVKNRNGLYELCIYGAGTQASILQSSIADYFKILAYFDSEPNRSRDWEPTAKILHPEELKKYSDKMILVATPESPRLKAELEVMYPPRDGGGYISMQDLGGGKNFVRDYLKFRHFDETTIILLNPGKVASSAIRSMLEKSKIDVVHLHTYSKSQEIINEEVIKRFVHSLSDRLVSEYRRTVCTGQNFRKGIQRRNETCNGSKSKIVSGFREPVSWLLSMLVERSYWLGFSTEIGLPITFESFQNILNDWDSGKVTTATVLVDYLIDIYSNWKQRELELLMDETIVFEPCPYQRFHTEKFELLFYRYEDLHKDINPIREFAGVSEMSLQRVHETNKKPGISWYPHRISGVTLPKSRLGKLYDLAIVKSLYTESEISNFRNKWNL